MDGPRNALEGGLIGAGFGAAGTVGYVLVVDTLSNYVPSFEAELIDGGLGLNILVAIVCGVIGGGAFGAAAGAINKRNQ